MTGSRQGTSFIRRLPNQQTGILRVDASGQPLRPGARIRKERGSSEPRDSARENPPTSMGGASSNERGKGAGSVGPSFERRPAISTTALSGVVGERSYTSQTGSSLLPSLWWFARIVKAIV